MEIVAILDNIRSLHNVGSIFRTADGAGVKKIYLTGITPSPVNRFKKVRPQIQKVALGAEATVAWEKISDSETTIKKLKNEGYTVYAVEQSNQAVPYHETKPKRGEKIALVLGAEVKGLNNSILNIVDVVIEVPMQGKIVKNSDHPKHLCEPAGRRSLNVSIAFGIVAYYFQYENV